MLDFSKYKFYKNINVGLCCYDYQKGDTHKVYTNKKSQCFILLNGKRHYFRFMNKTLELTDFLEYI